MTEGKFSLPAHWEQEGTYLPSVQECCFTDDGIAFIVFGNKVLPRL